MQLTSGNHEEEDTLNTNFCCVDHSRLTDFVRNHYISYLDRQLQENVNAWSAKYTSKQHSISMASKIKQCVQELEQRAIKMCMVAQLYQRSMVKIIAKVRRATQECRLEHTLYELLHGTTKNMHTSQVNKCYVDKITQTDNSFPDEQSVSNNDNEHCTKLTLQEKIDLFQAKYNCPETIRSDRNSSLLSAKHHRKNNYKQIAQTLDLMKMPSKSSDLQTQPKYQISPKSPGPKLKTSPAPPEAVSETPAIMDKADDDDDDDIARELAKMFGEEKTDLDEIFGIDPCATTDDPEIASILKEIECAKMPHEEEHVSSPSTLDRSTTTANSPNSSIPRILASVDLSKSLWPCELYMQRRRLNTSLTQLIEEDLRWQEIMMWKFEHLFGEDSDDEFLVCSPSIDLDDVLMGSCIRRITPWLVHHLMKPWSDGLIANRFLFKRLAKELAEAIIRDNQYPTNIYIKNAVEYYFCVQHAVRTIEDLNTMPRISADCHKILT